MSNFQLKLVPQEASTSKFEAETRWDHRSYDQTHHEEDSQGKWYKTKNPRKQKADTDDKRSKGRNNKNSSKWAHDKQEYDSLNTVSAETGSYHAKGNQRGSKKERKPDRQLYIVREKRSQNEEAYGENGFQKGQIETNPVAISAPKATKEGGQASEDDRSYISTGSTAISERLKNLDEDGSLYKEEIVEKAMAMGCELSGGHSPKIEPSEDEEPLFTICLESNESLDVISIFESERDYESFLDQLCQTHNIKEREALCFKINILQMIHDVHSEPKRIKPLLNKLLETNYKLILAELETEDYSGCFEGASDIMDHSNISLC